MGDELEARSVVVNAERELADPFGYGDGKGSERTGWTGLPEETGAGREMSRRGAGEPCAEKVRRLPSFVAVQGCPSESAIPGVFPERIGERPRGAREMVPMMATAVGQISWDRLATSGFADPSVGHTTHRATASGYSVATNTIKMQAVTRPHNYPRAS